VHWLGGTQLAGTSVADLRVAMPTLAMILVSVAALVMAMLATQIRRTRWVAFGSVALLLELRPGLRLYHRDLTCAPA